MSRTRFRIAIASLQLIGMHPTNVWAKSEELRFSALHLIPSNADESAEVKTARIGEAVLNGNLAYESSARLHKPNQMTIHGLSVDLDESPLLEASGLTVSKPTYCTGQFALQKEARENTVSDGTGKIEVRFEKNVRVCLVDTNSDSRFDMAFIYGATATSTRAAIQIENLEYTSDRLSDVVGKVRLLFHKGGNVSTNIPMLTVQASMGRFDFEDATVSTKPDGKQLHLLPYNRKVSGKSYPLTLPYGDAVVTVLSYNKNDESIQYRLDHNFVNRSAKVEFIRSGVLGYTLYVFE